jgi:hypothetical protein
MLFAAELIAVAILRIPYDLGFNAFAFADRGSWLTVVALAEQGRRPAIDFGYTYGLLPIWLSSGWFHLWGATPHAYQTANVIVSLTMGWAIARIVRSLHSSLAEIALAIVALPFAVQSSYPSIAHLIEAALLCNAIAEHAAGRRSSALVLAAAACFAKPSMGYVYGLILIILIARDLNRRGQLSANQADWSAIGRRLLPAVAVTLIFGTIALIVNGPASLISTILPISGVKHYAIFDYGFFRGRGRYFWYGVPLSYVFGSVEAFWFAASGWLIVRAIASVPRLLRIDRDRAATVRDEIVVAAAIMHVLFVAIFFAGPNSWSSYSYILVIGALAACANGRRGMIAVLGLTLLAATGQTGAILGGWLSWKQRAPDPVSAGLWATAETRAEWQQVLDALGGKRAAIVSPQGAVPILFPEFERTEYAYLLAGVTRPEEIATAKREFAEAPVIVEVIDADYGWAMTLMPEVEAPIASRKLILRNGMFAVFDQALN